MNKSKRANRFNVKRIVFCELLKDDESGVEIGKIRKLGDPMTVQLTFAAGELYGGGVKTEDMTKLQGVELKVDVNKITIENRAILGGHKYEDGVLIQNKDDQAPDIAIGYEIEQTGNHQEFVWLFKGKARPIVSKVEQSTNNITFSTDSIDFGFVPRIFDGHIKADGDTSNANFTSEKASTFLNTVPGATLIEGEEE